MVGGGIGLTVRAHALLYIVNISIIVTIHISFWHFRVYWLSCLLM